MRVVAVRNALNWHNLNPTVEQVAVSVTPELKQAAFNNFISFAYLPMFLGIITYIIWRIDHYVSNKTDKEIRVRLK